MDDYSRYQSKGRYNPPARGGPSPHDSRSQAPPPRGSSSRGGGPDSYGYAPPSPNPPPSYHSDDGSRDRRELFGDRGANPRPRGNDRYASQQDDRYGSSRSGYGDSSSNSRYDAQQNRYGGGGSGGRYYSEEDNDAYGDSRFAQQQEDEEVDGIKQQIKFTKQDTLASTRNALNKIREAEDVGGQTLNRLGQQSEQIANVNRNLDLAKDHSDRAINKAGELKQLQRSMFIPVIKNPFTKKSRELKELESVRQNHREHAATREEIRKYEYESQQRLAESDRQRQRQRQKYGLNDGSSKSERERYQFEGDAEDDELENELDSNMDEISAAANRLKNLALTMNTELTVQNDMLVSTGRRVDPLAERITTTTHRINNIK